ncbi:hypothetical protein L3X38_013501 [Prunus dulcis]|uniref:Uncharacterized protein n=1 Tax=Prunus dulcis TaxID=3755 RepID=A0AAD4ZH31_PRUDU|nr:hypothetical protein L3X38_013501 [Prunus dulcis]
MVFSAREGAAAPPCALMDPPLPPPMNLSNETNAAAAADEIEVEDVQAAQPKQASLEQLMIHMLEKWITKLRLSKVGRKLMVERATASPRRGNNTPRDVTTC